MYICQYIFGDSDSEWGKVGCCSWQLRARRLGDWFARSFLGSSIPFLRPKKAKKVPLGGASPVTFVIRGSTSGVAVRPA